MDRERKIKLENLMSTKQTDIESIDFLKLIGSIMIFIMHLGVFGSVWSYFSRWAVPFFFIVSSFFYFSKSEKNYKKYVARIVSLYVCWLLINLPSIFYYKIYCVGGLYQINTWLNFIKNILLSSTFTGSWYLLASIWGIGIIQFLSKKLSTWLCLLVVFPIQLICISSSLYFGLLPLNIANVFDYLLFPLNIFGGIFYIAVGKIIAEKRTSIKSIPFVYLIAAGVFLLVSIAENVFVKENNWFKMSDCSFSIIGAAIFLVLFCLTINLTIKKSRELRKISTIIFCGQGNIILSSGFVTHRLLNTDSFIILFFVAIVMMSLLIVLILYIQKRSTLGFAKYLT